MKLEKILDSINSLEKNSFLKIVDNIINSNPKKIKEIEKILSDNNVDLKSVDNANISKVFNLITHEFTQSVKSEFVNTTSQLDILIDIIIRDGNAILKREWLGYLYEKELSSIKKKTRNLKNNLLDEKSELDEQRIRDYNIYKACVKTAYNNDLENNREAKITDDELSILLCLAQKLELSQEEIKLINYLIIPPEKHDIDEVISFLKNIGVIFYSRKNSQLYIADEMVRVLRKIREKDLADKYYRRILKALREPQLNLICRKHNIDIKDQTYETKIKLIISEGIPISTLLQNSLHKEGTKLTEKKKLLNDLWENGLKISTPLHGLNLEDKISNLINYFEDVERDEKVGISIEGYERLLIDLTDVLPNLQKQIQNEFEMQDDKIENSQYYLDFNIKPRDILDLISNDDLKTFIAAKELKSRGDLILNILDAYKDAENLYIENYEHLGFRNLSELKENGIIIKESELGLKFEDVTRTIFEQLEFNVDEKLKKQLNSTKNKMDLILNLGNNDVIIVECKTIKESGYNKFSSVSRQIKSYVDQAKNNGFNVVKSLLIAPDFSDDFVNDCGLEFEINLSLITAGSLVNILDGFRSSKHKKFPYQLLMKDVLIKEDRILKAISR
ncbi:hypothetical protein EO244_04750 [Ancylomarina salipaludis]|uniref:Uncharacterized protein n=1 Tax=Ancylomarina salipaludis TaxID=2501299 RepID=A0A4Q1JNM7_9BACT|nr:hypothetical protein [Ancylomarina salipaludis]RXQ96153.1 hypothetical protein EO244_04750 [Ancylomarina salipaludis]